MTVRIAPITPLLAALALACFVTPGGGLAAPARADAATVKSRGPEVRQLQRRIGVAADGVFGPATKRALRRWQRRHGLTADGIAGPQTRAALNLGPGPVLKRGRLHSRTRTRTRARGGRSGGRRGGSHRGGGRRSDVRRLQRAVGVPADGVFGPATEAALKRWQARHGLLADGIAGPQTRRALSLAAGPILRRRGPRGGGGGTGRKRAIINRVIAAANRIATTPYKYGGGHRSWTDTGYDCSGSISYALHGGGLLGSPLDSTAFMSWGAPGRGRHITIYANRGHAYMVIDGRRFDTSARYETGSRWTSTHRSGAGFTVRHPPGF